MSDTIKEETDFERTKRYFLEIKNNIPKFTDNLEYISQNIDLLNNNDIQSALNYLIVGLRLTELDLDEIKDNYDLAKKGCSFIDDNIDILKKNIDFLLENNSLLKDEKLHAPIGMISVGCQALETLLDEIRNPRE